MINLKKLKDLTKQSKDKAQSEMLRKMSEAAQKALLQAEINKAQAAIVISDIQAKGEKAAKKQENSCLVLKVEGYNLASNLLSGVPKIVWDFCEKEGLQPDLIYQHDGMGMKSWYEIWIKW